MQSKIILSLLLCLKVSLVCAQDIIDDTAVSALTGGTEKIARKMISASFTPFTDYSRGDLLSAGALGYTQIDRVWTNPEITGDSLTGITLGGGAGYAVTDRLALYGIGDLLLVNGRLETSFFSDSNGDTGGRFNLYLANLFAGAGFDLVDAGPFSLPLYLGLHCTASSFKAVLDRVSISTPVSGSAEARITGGGLTAGVSGGIAGEARIGRFTLGGYGLIMADFTGLSGESTVTVTPTVGADSAYAQTHSAEPFRGTTYGFSAEFSPRKQWALGLDFSDFLPFGEDGESGVAMSTLAVTVCYRGD
jgi:hypothetical protein